MGMSGDARWRATCVHACVSDCTKGRPTRLIYVRSIYTFRAIYYGDCVPFAFPLIDVSDRVAPAAHLECILHATILSAHTTYCSTYDVMPHAGFHATRAAVVLGVPYRPRPRSAQMCYHALLY